MRKYNLKQNVARLMVAALMLLLILPAFMGCNRNKTPETIELNLAQTTAIGAKALAAVGEAYDIAVQEGIATPAERDAAFRELRPILTDAEAVTGLLDEATGLSKSNLDRLLAFFDKTGNVFARLLLLQKLDGNARKRIADASVWLTRITSAARIAIAAIPPTQRNASAVAPNALRLESLKLVISTKDLPMLTPGNLRTIDMAIDRLTNLGVNLVVDAFNIKRMTDVVQVRETRKLAFTQLDQKLDNAGL